MLNVHSMLLYILEAILSYLEKTGSVLNTKELAITTFQFIFKSKYLVLLKIIKNNLN